ncbi:putative fatty acid synthase [Tieghemostelium lacteum]|uniref:Putative fatty acid synthase n=1 Tax=Tieghemostelium lacteum TaxID=361077 RepID=A0A151Z2I0_TIELA|nr:putative fatty acid synthase [Tieghemostelium lacteum]|eukprot:KYQ88159.1 putative fatty acid synthase [Tieghemostelium lacteum]
MVDDSLVNNEDIAIIGIGCRFPGNSNTPMEFWNNLISEHFNGIVEIPEERWSKKFYEQGMINNCKSGLIDFEHWKRFDSIFFGVSAKEATALDPQQRLLLAVLWEALEDAHIKPSEFRGSDTSVYVGCMNQGYCDLDEALRGGIGTSTFLSNSLSFSYDLRGPSMTVDSACSSSLNTIHLGCQSILSGQSKISVCGGVNALFDPRISISFSQKGILSKSGISRPFDADADGYVRGEGAGLVILKRLSDAISDSDRIYAIIKGSRSNCDGANLKSYPMQPSGKAQFENIQETLKQYQVEPEDIYYIEAHGTSTGVGDPIEAEAVSMAFKDNHSSDHPLYIGSLKSNIGHLEGACGVASLIKVSLMLKFGKLAPNICFKKPNPKIDFNQWNLKVVTEVQDIVPLKNNRPVLMGINCFGIGGSNCFMILQQFPNSTKIQSQEEEINEIDYLIPISVNSQQSFDNYHDKIVSKQNDISFINFVNYSCNSKDLKLSKRFIITAKNWNDFNQKRNIISSTSIDYTKTTPPIIFVFTGQGPQWKGMGQYLYSTNSIFKKTIDNCDQLLKKYFGYSILQKLNNLDNIDEIHHPILAQPSIFLIQVGLIKFLKSWGIKPNIVLGHSFGEITSALCSGILTLENAVKIIYYRACCQQKTIGSGKMMSIGIGLDKFNQLNLPNDGEIEIACFNSPDSIVLTGNENSLKSIQSRLKELDIFCAFLGTPCSFHSSKQDAIRDEFLQSLSDLPKSMEPKIPFYSTVTGKQMKGDSFYNQNFIFDNLRQPVRFEEAIQNIYLNLLDESSEVSQSPIFIEITPHTTLSPYIPSCLSPIIKNDQSFPTPIILSTMNKKKLESDQIFNTLSQLYCNGINLNFKYGQCLDSDDYKFNSYAIPKYQWDKSKEYWNLPIQVLKSQIPSIDLIGELKSSDNSGSLQFETVIDLRKPAFQFLKGHIIKGKFIFPGCGYIDILLNLYSGQDLSVYNLIFEKACLISNDQPVIIKTDIQPINKKEFNVEFFYKSALHSDQKWTRSCHGKFGLNSLNYINTLMDINQIKEECNYVSMEKVEIYHRLSQLGLPYGPSFQNVLSIESGEKSSLGVLDTNNPIHGFILNAAILDSACHSVTAGLDPPQEIVFESVKNLNYYPSNLSSVNPKTLLVYGKVLGQFGNNTLGSIDIINPDNSKIIIQMTVQSASLTKIKHKNNNNIYQLKFPKKNLYSTNWQSKESILNNNNIINQLNQQSFIEIITKLFNSITVNQYYLIKILYFNNNNSNNDNLNRIINIIQSNISNNINLNVDFNILSFSGTEELISNQILEKEEFNNSSFVIRNRIIHCSDIELFNPSQEYLLSSNYDLIILPLISPINSINETLQRLLLPNGWLLIGDDNNINIFQKESLFNNNNNNNNNNENMNIFLLKSSNTTKNIKDSITFLNSNSIINSSQIQSNSELKDGDMIFFLVSDDNLNKENYLSISMEYISISQYLQENSIRCKLVLLTINDKDSYLINSLIGCYRYLKSETDLVMDSYSINMDKNEKTTSLQLSIVVGLLDFDKSGDFEYQIRNGQIQVQRLLRDSTIRDNEESKENLYQSLNKFLDFQCHSRLEIPDSHIEIQVMASGINFKDYLYYCGLIPQQIYPDGHDIFNPPFGLECSGIVTRVGKNSKFSIGSRVFGIATNSISTHVIAAESQFQLIPDNINWNEAASIPITHLTSYYSLFHLCNIHDMDSILIHSASGGLGLATLNILRWKQYKGRIFVTVGSSEKEIYLREHYSDMITDYFNSRSQSYSKEILLKYGGVDLILNTLSGEFLSSNFNCLTKTGRIIDLTISQLENEKLFSIVQSQYPKCYQVFELIISSTTKPLLFSNIMKIIIDSISSGNLKMVPLTIYSSNQVKEAIQSLSKSKHIGKLMVNFENHYYDISKGMIKDQYQLSSLKETLLITGQSGIVIPILKWIIQRSTKSLKNIIILSRSAMKWDLKWLISYCTSKCIPIKIHFRQCNVSDKSEIINQIESIQKELSEPILIKSIIHFAAVYEYVSFEKLTEKSFQITHNPKVIGAINLHELSLELKWSLDNYILISSTASITAGATQGPYNSANLMLDHLAIYRRSIGLSAVSINFGAMSYGEASNIAVADYVTSQGLNIVSSPKMLGALEIALSHSSPANFICANLDFVKFYCQSTRLQSKIEHLIQKPDQIYQYHNRNALNMDGEVSDLILQQLTNIVANILSVDPSSLNHHIKLKDYGIDSLLTSQLKSDIEETFKVNNTLFTHVQLITNTTNNIAQKISNSK